MSKLVSKSMITLATIAGLSVSTQIAKADTTTNSSSVSTSTTATSQPSSATSSTSSSATSAQSTASSVASSSSAISSVSSSQATNSTTASSASSTASSATSSSSSASSASSSSSSNTTTNTDSSTSTSDTTANMTHAQFLAAIKAGAIAGWKQYGVLPSLTAAQAILESSWGQSSLATKYNNLFGIKGSYNGSSVSLLTSEYVNGAYTKVYANFRVYPSFAESIADHNAFLVNNSRYKNLLNVADAATVTKLISADGYATSPTYTSSLMSIINSQNLTEWDKEAGATTTNTSTSTSTNTSSSSTTTTTNTANTSSSNTSASTTNTYYTVKSGDTGYAIAKKYNITLAQLTSWNASTVSNINKIYVGQKLIVAKSATNTATSTTSNTSTSSNTATTNNTTTNSSTSTSNNYYTVVSGNSLWAIAVKYGTTVANLKSWNNLTSNTIYVGQKLIVSKTTTSNTSNNTSSSSSATNNATSSSKTYVTVKSGDTLWGLANKYSTTILKIKNLNNLKSNTIYIGQKLEVK